MQQLKICGGARLVGEIKASGAKNAVLPMLAATLLTEEKCVLQNVPKLRDVNTFVKLLRAMGVVVEYHHEDEICIAANCISAPVAAYDLVKTMRASVLVLGALLARGGYAKVSLPGGCAIGARPVDQHIKGLRAMGATIAIEDGYIIASAKKLQGVNFTFDLVTVTGSENLLMAAVLAEGRSVLQNVAREPEITALANFLNKMGAQITGIGSATLTIEGVAHLRAARENVLPDRIEIATLLTAAAITEGDVTVTHTAPALLDEVLSKLRASGATIDCGADFIRLQQRRRARAVSICTAPFPDFPTDMQAQFMALNCVATGSATVVETIFENRFMHVNELQRMGANISINGNTATIIGVENLSGAQVMATDLRASAGLIIAALAARGTTTIDRIYHLDRGYDAIEKKLQQLGANIERINKT